MGGGGHGIHEIFLRVSVNHFLGKQIPSWGMQQNKMELLFQIYLY